jgi:hypothetical protein
MLPDIRFTWKTTLPFETRFQIADHPGFASPLIDEAVGGEVFQGRPLSEGTWYWRIQARGSGGAVFETPPQSFIAAPPIAAPLLLEPAPGGRLVIQEGIPAVFSWAASEGAEYYQFRLYYGEDRNSLVYENNLVEGTSESLSMDSYPNGNYYWTIRGFAAESSRGTRRTGLYAAGLFMARKLHPVSLDSPGNGVSFEGLRAYREPVSLRWSSMDQAETSRLILSTSSDFTGPPVVLIDTPPPRIRLPTLAPGTYYWTVRAETSDGFDISARAPRWFRVLPIPPLPRAANRLPENGRVIGSTDLRTNRRIVFSWDAVAGATGYIFTLENADTGKILMQRGPMAERTLVLEDLSLLDVGNFIWRLEAVAIAPPASPSAGEIIRRGEIGENRFRIDFTLPGAQELQRPGVLYGRE